MIYIYYTVKSVIAALMGGNFHDQQLYSRVCRITSWTSPWTLRISAVAVPGWSGTLIPTDATSTTLASDELKLSYGQLAAAGYH